MNRPSIIPLLVVTILVAIALTAIALYITTAFLSAGKTEDMFIQLETTFIGAVLALAVGGVLFWYQTRRTDKKRHEELRSLLKAELLETLEKVEKARADE